MSPLMAFITRLGRLALIIGAHVGPIHAGEPKPRALTTRRTTVWSNNTSTISGINGFGTGLIPTGINQTGVLPTSIFSSGIGLVLPTRYSRYRYNGTLGVATVLNVTTIISTVLVIPTPVGNGTVANGTRGIAPIKDDGKMVAYYADPLKYKLVNTSTDSEVEPTSASFKDWDGNANPDLYNRETVAEALDFSLSMAGKLYTTRAGFRAHTPVFVHNAKPTDVASYEKSVNNLDCRNINDGTTHLSSEALLEHIKKLELAGLIHTGTALDSRILDNITIIRREELAETAQPTRTKLHGDFTIEEALDASIPLLPNHKIGAGADSFESHFDRPLRNSTRPSHKDSAFANYATAHGHEPTGAQPRVEAKLPLLTFNTVPILDAATLGKCAEEHFKYRLGLIVDKRTAQAEDIETVEAVDDALEVIEAAAKREAEADPLLILGEADLFSKVNHAKPVTKCETYVVEISGGITRIISTIAPEATGNTRRQTATKVDGIVAPDFHPKQATTLRRIKLALTRSAPMPTTTLDAEKYGNANPNIVNMPTQVGVELDLAGISYEAPQSPKATDVEKAN